MYGADMPGLCGCGIHWEKATPGLPDNGQVRLCLQGGTHARTIIEATKKPVMSKSDKPIHRSLSLTNSKTPRKNLAMDAFDYILMRHYGFSQSKRRIPAPLYFREKLFLA